MIERATSKTRELLWDSRRTFLSIILGSNGAVVTPLLKSSLLQIPGGLWQLRSVMTGSKITRVYLRADFSQDVD